MRYSLKTNFTPGELSCNCGCGIMPADEAIIALQALRQYLGIPFVINSACRCESHNRQVGGVVNSRHIPSNNPGYSGSTAFDIKTDKYQRAMIVQNAPNFGFKGIGIYDTFVHIDMRRELTIWTS